MALRGRMSQTTKTAMRVKEAMIARRGCLEEGRMVGKSMTWAFSREYADMGRGGGVVGERDGGRGNASPQCVRPRFIRMDHTGRGRRLVRPRHHIDVMHTRL